MTAETFCNFLIYQALFQELQPQILYDTMCHLFDKFASPLHMYDSVIFADVHPT